MTKHIYYVYAELGEFVGKAFTYKEAKRMCRNKNYEIKMVVIR